jgi:multiple sugar transport system substrate-binding protein
MSVAKLYQVLSRRRVLGVAGGTVGAVLTAACGATPPPTAAPAPTKPAEAPKPTEAPKSGAAAPATAPAAAAPTTAPAPAAAATKPAAAAPAAATKQTTVEYWYHSDDAAWAKVIADSLDRFRQKQPAIMLKHDLLPTIVETRKKVLTSFAAGAGMPDVWFGGQEHAAEFYPAKVIIGLDDRVKGWKGSEDWLPNMPDLSRGRPSDPIGMVPSSMSVFYLYYRVDWLQEAKIKPPDTLDELLEAAKALTKAPERFGYGMRGGDSGSFGQQVGQYLKGDGVEIVKPDGTVDLDSPEAIARVQWFQEFTTKHKVTQPSALTDRFPELFAALGGGKLALVHHGLHSWRTQDDALHEKVSAIPIPKGNKRRWVLSGSSGNMVGAPSKAQDQAFELAAFLGEVEQVRPFAHQVGYGPILKSMLNDAIFKENRFYKVALDSQPNWGTFPSWHQNYPKFTDRWTPEFQRLLRSEITAEQFCKTVADVLRKG